MTKGVIASPHLSETAIEALRIEGAPALSITDEHSARLAWHCVHQWQIGVNN